MKYQEIKRAVELVKAESEGRVIELPCKIGDWVLFHYKGEVYKGYVKDFKFATWGYFIEVFSSDTGSLRFKFSDFGRLVYLEAEAS